MDVDQLKDSGIGANDALADGALNELLRAGVVPATLGRDQVVRALISAGFDGWISDRPHIRLANQLVSVLLRQHSDGRLTPVELLAGLSALRNGSMMRARLLRFMGEAEYWLGSPAALQAPDREYAQLLDSVGSLFGPTDLEARRLEIADLSRLAQKTAREQAQQAERRRQHEAEQVARANALALARLAARELEVQERVRREAAHDEEQKRRSACERLASLFITSHADATFVPLAKLRLEDSDIRLVLNWLSCPEPSRADIIARSVFPATLSNWFGRTFGDDSDSVRLAAARLAEKAAARFYADSGETVEDVSIEQLVPAATQWKTHDLLVGGRPIDVKHARESWSRPNAYTEHCVPKFKKERSEPVIITGVFSRALSLQQLQISALAPTDAAFIVLGKTTEAEISRVTAYFSEESRISVGVSRLRNGKSFIPCWAFDSEIRVRLKHPVGGALSITQDLELAVSKGSMHGVNLAAVGWLVFEPLPTYLSAWLSERHGQFLNRASTARAEAGLALPVVYLLVLTEILSTLSQECVSLEHIRECIYIERDDENWRVSQWPLGTWDPLGSVHSLLAAFAHAIERNAEWLRDFQEYRLSGLNILEGLRRNGQWVTVLAYCGGWNQEVARVYRLPEKDIDEWKPRRGEYRDGQDVYEVRSVVKCGETPLVLGACELCQCGKLICPSCGFCQQGCSACAERQFRHALRERPADKDPRSQTSGTKRGSVVRPSLADDFDDDIPY